MLRETERDMETFVGGDKGDEYKDGDGYEDGDGDEDADKDK